MIFYNPYALELAKKVISNLNGLDEVKNLESNKHYAYMVEFHNIYKKIEIKNIEYGLFKITGYDINGLTRAKSLKLNYDEMVFMYAYYLSSMDSLDGSKVLLNELTPVNKITSLRFSETRVDFNIKYNSVIYCINNSRPFSIQSQTFKYYKY